MTQLHCTGLVTELNAHAKEISFNNKVVCPNFRHLFLTSSFTEYKFLQLKNMPIIAFKT